MLTFGQVLLTIMPRTMILTLADFATILAWIGTCPTHPVPSMSTRQLYNPQRGNANISVYVAACRFLFSIAILLLSWSVDLGVNRWLSLLGCRCDGKDSGRRFFLHIMGCGFIAVHAGSRFLEGKLYMYIYILPVLRQKKIKKPKEPQSGHETRIRCQKK
jgi:hypothetical protein